MKEKKNFSATCSEICEYIEKEVKPGDSLKLSLGRCYIPGNVITNSQGILQIEVYSDMIKGLSRINFQELKEFLVELEHESENKVYTIEAKND
jgi:hypothetical protein